jgi:hypothetical protein
MGLRPDEAVWFFDYFFVRSPPPRHLFFGSLISKVELLAQQGSWLVYRRKPGAKPDPTPPPPKPAEPAAKPVVAPVPVARPTVPAAPAAPAGKRGARTRDERPKAAPKPVKPATKARAMGRGATQEP